MFGHALNTPSCWSVVVVFNMVVVAFNTKEVCE